MRKVKNFKINLRVKEITRVIKKLTNSEELPVELEGAIARACKDYLQFICPSMIYETFTKDKIVFDYIQDAPSKWVARSIFFVTIGTKLLDEYQRKEDAYGEHTEKIVSAIAVDALEQAKNFVHRLIVNEADDSENCDVTRSVDVPSDYCEELVKVIPIDKIDVRFEDKQLLPKYSQCSMVYWLPSKKRSKK